MVLLRILEKVYIHPLKVPLFVRGCGEIFFPEIEILVFILHGRVVEHLSGLGGILDLVAEHEAAYFTAASDRPESELGLLILCRE